MQDDKVINDTFLIGHSVFTGPVRLDPDARDFVSGHGKLMYQWAMEFLDNEIKEQEKRIDEMEREREDIHKQRAKLDKRIEGVQTELELNEDRKEGVRKELKLNEEQKEQLERENQAVQASLAKYRLDRAEAVQRVARAKQLLAESRFRLGLKHVIGLGVP